MMKLKGKDLREGDKSLLLVMISDKGNMYIDPNATQPRVIGKDLIMPLLLSDEECECC